MERLDNELDICYNNKFYRADQGFLGINRALRYGDGIFESIRIIDGKPAFLEYHLNRIHAALEALKIKSSKEKIQEIQLCIDQIIVRNEIEKGGYLRLTIFRAGLGKYTPQDHQLDYIIEADKLEHNNFKFNSKGLKIDISKEAEIFPSAISTFKTLNALPYVIASIENVERELDDLVLLNNKGKIVEMTSSNLFIIKDGVLVTPTLEDGCISGIMRHMVIKIAKKMKMSFEEKSLEPSHLEVADEIFITNSVRGIQWVGSYRNNRYFNRITKKILQELIAFR